MSNVFVDKTKIDNLANAISVKSGESVPMTLTEMTQAVDGIESGGGSAEPNLQSKTYSVDGAGTETITADVGYDGLSEVEVSVPEAHPLVTAGYGYLTVSGVRKWNITPEANVGINYGYDDGYLETGQYLGNDIQFNAVPSNTTITPSTSAQTIGGANYMMESAVTVSAMPSGTAGTPTATKGAVSNHSVSVTPSVTNTTGYITGSTKTGTAVTVSASELVSGDKSITANGNNIDVANYSTVSVNVSGGGNDFIVTLTQNQQGEWMPDCTYAELYSAYTAGKNIVATAGGYLAALIFFEDGYFYYAVHDGFDEFDQSGIYDWGIISESYIFSSEGAELDEEAQYYNLSLGNATPSDVTSGKIFYNSQGIQVGTNSGGGGSLSYDTKTATASDYPTSLSFTSMRGQPKFFAVRLNAQVSSSGSTTYYYIVDIVSNCNGSSAVTHGNCFRIGSTRRVDNITSGYSYTYSGTTLTITSSAASRSASPGAFYNGSYELIYAY